MLKILIVNRSGKITEEFAPVLMRFVSSEDAPADSLYARLDWCGKTGDFFSCRAELDGKELFCGRIDELTEYQSESGCYTEIRARSLQALLLDNEAKPQSYCIPSFDLIFEKHFRPLGFSSFIGPAGAFNGELNITKGMSEWKVLEEFCRIFTKTTPRIINDGVIDISGEHHPEIIHIGKNRLISFQKKMKKSMLISDLYVRTYNAGGYDLHISSDNAEMLGVKRIRYYNAAGNRTMSYDDITGMLQKAENKAESITLECIGAVTAQTGDIIKPEGDRKSYYIRDICITAGEKGIRTKITAGVKGNVAK